VNAKRANGDTALLAACTAYLDWSFLGGSTPPTVTDEGRIELVRTLLAADADVNAVDSDGWTALMKVSRQGAVELVNDLLSAGADVNGRNDAGWTALIFAISWKHPETARLLLTTRQT
jgi:ankyrin repeat protein